MALYRYACNECGKTYIGEPRPGMMCNCHPPHIMIGTPYVARAAPLSQALLQSLRIQQATELRGELCARWGIDNYSHSTHGSNFAGSQTVVQLINNIVEKLDGATRARVRLRVIADYQYDIDTKSMT